MTVKSFRIFGLLPSLMLLVWPAPNLYAEEVHELPQITVIGEEVGPSQLAGSSTTRIKSSAYQRRSTHVSEVLATQAGVHLNRFGGLEEATSISIRGSGEQEVTVLLDGVPLNLAQTGSTVSIPIMMEELERVDIYRGQVPLGMGFSPAAGAVSLTSKSFASKPQGHFSLSVGSFETVRTHISHASTDGRWQWLTAVTFLSTRGNFTFRDDNGTPLNGGDDERVQRQNNESINLHPHAKARYSLNERSYLDLIVHYLRNDKGVPGMSTNQSRHADLSHSEWILGFQWHRQGLWEWLDLETHSYLRRVQSQYTDLKSEIGLGGAQDNDDQTWIAGQVLSLSHAWEWQKLSLSLLYQWEEYQPHNYLLSPATGGTSKRHRWELGMGDEIRLFDERLFIHPVFWFENIDNDLTNNDPSFLTPAIFNNTRGHHEFSGRLGIVFALMEDLSLRGHVNRSFRVPSFSELFGDRGGVVGNAFLEPQRSLNWDLGFKWWVWAQPSGSSLNISMEYFDRIVTDLIQFEQNAGFVRAENIGRARVMGFEGQVQMEWAHLSGLLSYTFQWAKDQTLGNGRFLTGRPRHELHTHLAYHWRRLECFGDLSWMDENFLDPLNTRVVKDRVLVGLGFSYRLTQKVDLSLEAKNLTNNQIVDLVGFPLPGRGFFGRLDWQL